MIIVGNPSVAQRMQGIQPCGCTHRRRCADHEAAVTGQAECGCPVRVVAANRADRRRASKHQNGPVTVVALHRDDCWLSGRTDASVKAAIVPTTSRSKR